MAFIVILGLAFVFSSMSIKIVFVLIFVQCAIKTKGKITFENEALEMKILKTIGVEN